MTKKDKKSSVKFTGIFLPAGVLAIRKINMIEKIIICDIRYFEGGYRFGNERLAEKLGVSRRTIVNSISRLKSDKIGLVVDTTPGKKGRYVRHLKLTDAGLALFGSKDGAGVATYSSKDGAGVATYGAKVATLGGKDGAKVATESNKGEINTVSNKIHTSDSNEYRLSELLLELLVARQPNFKLPKIQQWAECIDLLIRVDGRTVQRVETVIRWTQAEGCWWRNRILSPQSLRKHFDTLEMQMLEVKEGKQNAAYTKRGSNEPVSAFIR